MGKTNNVESLVNRTTVQGSGATQSQGFVSHPFLMLLERIRLLTKKVNQ